MIAKAMPALALLATLAVAAQIPNGDGTPRSIGRRSIQPARGYIWTSFEEGGHQWMVGARKEDATAHDDPVMMDTSFANGYSVKVQGYGQTILHHDCCTTNIVIGTNYTGTIQIGTNVFKASQLIPTKKP